MPPRQRPTFVPSGILIHLTVWPQQAWAVLGRRLVKRFALCYRTVVRSVCLSCHVCNVVVLWPNGWMDQDKTWHARRPRHGHIVLDGNWGSSPMGRPFAPSHGGIWTPSNIWFLWPTRVLNPNGISIGAAVFAGLTSVTDRPTDHATRSVTIDYIYIRSTAMRPNNNKK